MRIIFYILLMAAGVLFFGCSSTETIIKDRKIEITVPGINDTLPVKYNGIPEQYIPALDSIFQMMPDTASIEAKGIKVPKVKIRYFPKRGEFVFEVEPQKVDTTIRDTTKITTIKEDKKTTVTEKLGYATFGIIFFVILVLAGFLCFKFKVFK